MKTLDELDALYERATGGPWHVEPFTDAGNGRSIGTATGVPIAWIRVGTPAVAGIHGTRGVTPSQRDHDARLIVALVNAWPEVRERLGRAERERDALRAAARRVTLATGDDLEAAWADMRVLLEAAR